MVKGTIAILGVTEETAAMIAKKLAAGYRLLFFSIETEKMKALEKEIKKTVPNADIESMACVSDASWEADFIIVDVPADKEQEIAEKIKMFCTRKIVILLLNKHKYTTGILEKLLPDTIFVKAIVDGRHVNIVSGDEEALQVTADIMQTAGLIPGLEITY